MKSEPSTLPTRGAYADFVRQEAPPATSHRRGYVNLRSWVHVVSARISVRQVKKLRT